MAPLLLLGIVALLIVAGTKNAPRLPAPPPRVKPPLGGAGSFLAGSFLTSTGKAPTTKDPLTGQLKDELSKIPAGPSAIEDVSGNLSDWEWDWWEDDTLAYFDPDVALQGGGLSGSSGMTGNGSTTIHDGLDAAGRQARFHRQMWLPASRIKLSSLSQDDFRTALKLLSYQVDGNSRRRDSENYLTLEARFQDRLDAAEGWVLIIAKVVESIIGMGSLTAPLNDALAGAGHDGSVSYKDWAKGLEDAATKLTDSDAGKVIYNKLGYLPDLMAQELYPRPRDPSNPLNDNPLHHEDDEDFVTRWGNSSFAFRELQPWAGCDGTVYYPRRQLVGYLATGYYRSPSTRSANSRLQWSCVELAGKGKDDEDNHGLVDRTNRRARAYRALDVVASIMFGKRGPGILVPQADGSLAPGHGHQIPGLYNYKNPLFGDIKGSIFPPTDEDGPVGAEPGIVITAARTVIGESIEVHAGSQLAGQPVETVETTVAPSIAGNGSRYSLWT